MAPAGKSRNDIERFSSEEIQITKSSKIKKLKVENIEGLKAEASFDDHIIPLGEFYARYQTDPNQGLTQARALEIIKTEGLNIMTPSKTTPQWIIFCNHLFSGFSMILWIGGILSVAAYLIESNMRDEGLVDRLLLGIIMFVVVIISGTFSYYQDRTSSRIMDSFKKMVTHQATVIRDGKVRNIPAENLVRGDVVLVKFGNKVPADIRIIECFGMKVDNSSLTGESEPQPRGVEATSNNPLETQNLAFFSTNVMEGTCKGVVFQTGDRTVIGRLAKLTVGLKRVPSPIKREIKYFVLVITILSVFFALTLSIASWLLGFTVVHAIIYFIAILVANVPEGLLVTLTLCLTLTAKKMAKKNCLIKSLDSVETLGSTSIICSDKTGTLTQNRMTVTEMMYNFKTFEITYGADKSSTVNDIFDKEDPDFKNLMRCAQLCLRAEFENHRENVPVLNLSVEGDASEAAILKCVECIFKNVAGYRKKNPKIMEIPFNSINKYQLSIHRLENGSTLLVMKGAPEKILELCSTMSISGRNEPLTAKRRKDLDEILHNLGKKGERVLGFCDFELSDPPDKKYSQEAQNFPITNLRFLGLLAMIDPPRETVPDAVRKCKMAGIRVVMVTGDHPVTAEAIARKTGIITSSTRMELAEKMRIPADDVPQNLIKAIVLSGDELRSMITDQLDQILSKYQEIVFARTTPTQKLLIVESYQRLGFITAVTGDGVNDSPALKKADIGIAMGVTGSDVSKQAADMILLDDNFASIVSGVEEGRIIFDNLKKSVMYLLTSNMPEMAPFIAYIILQVPMPLSIIAVLIIDVGTDVLPGIALAYEKAESDIMLRKPRNPFHDTLVNRRLIWMAYGQIGIIQTAAGFCAYFIAFSEFGFRPASLIGIRNEWENEAMNSLTDSYGQQWTYEARKKLENYAQSSFFIAIIVTQMADAIICKTRRNSILQQGMSNWILNFGLILDVALGCFLLYTPNISDVILLSPIMFKHWLPGIPFGFAIVLFDEIRRLIIRRRPGGWMERETYY